MCSVFYQSRALGLWPTSDLPAVNSINVETTRGSLRILIGLGPVQAGPVKVKLSLTNHPPLRDPLKVVL